MAEISVPVKIVTEIKDMVRLWMAGMGPSGI
jgi:hypothetical protein